MITQILASAAGIGGIACFGMLIKVSMEKDDGQHHPGAALIPMDLPESISDDRNTDSLYMVTETTLADISYIWSGDELDFCQISTIWREKEEPVEKVKKLSRPTFKHEEIEAFWSEYIESRPLIVKGKRLGIIMHLIKMLDDEGVCPSVVNKNDNEAESQFAKNLYDKLASIPLWKHSLLVAKKYIAKFNEPTMIPDALIIALGHDIGKIPSYHDTYYKQGDHSWISVQILNMLPEYRALSNRDEIDRIIRGHHLLKTDYKLTNLLKEVDGEARKDETADIMIAEKQGVIFTPIIVEVPVPVIKDSDVIEEENKKPTAKPVAPKKRNAVAKPISVAVEDKVANPYGEGDGSGQPTTKFVPEMVELPEWYNSDRLISVLAKIINQLQVGEGNKTTWSAVTGESGIVWINEKAVWDGLRKIGGAEDSDFLVTEGVESDRRNFLLSVVTQLGKDNKTFYEMIGKNYYQVPVSIITGGDRHLSSFLIPFLQEIFGISSLDLENRKSATLKRMVKTIKPQAGTAIACPMP